MNNDYLLIQALAVVGIGAIIGLVIRIMRTGINIKHLMKFTIMVLKSFTKYLILLLAFPIGTHIFKNKVAEAIVDEFYNETERKYLKKDRNRLIRSVMSKLTVKRIIQIWGYLLKTAFSNYYEGIDKVMYESYHKILEVAATKKTKKRTKHKRHNKLRTFFNNFFQTNFFKRDVIGHDIDLLDKLMIKAAP